ncbi:serine hydrolase domain-containing protein [Pedobacter gandavensis]|uniref:Serine hydrolase n=1 Tax=Pedobacter gandavensis TaxID=2679963 RepID=A0ABR6ESV5_9SPHI|nr:serine hydrolase [Pedobacter gandavensis]MBB2148301.1 serine hydrolase [Pedobacter gandavensis]
MNLFPLRPTALMTCAMLFFCCAVNAQVAMDKKSPVITDPVHKSNIGKIVFTDKPVKVSQLAEAKPLQQYRMTNKSDLFLTVFLGNTMTGYLQQLAPKLDSEALVKSGNYQFSYYVDHKLIYQTNLMPGAPSPEQQNTLTVWSKPLIDNAHEGQYWSQSAWNRFMYNGGDKALTEGNHTLKIELRPYINSGTLTIGNVIAAGSLNLTVNKKIVVDLNKVSLSPVKPYAGLKVSNESFDRDKIKTLKANIEADAFRHITSVVVIKNGKILIEEYFNKATRDSLHDVRSVGKSFASTMTGIAINDGFLKSENQSLGEFYDLKSYEHYSAKKANTTLKELLTMSSDFDGNDDDGDSPGNEENMYPTADWLKFTLDLPMDTLKYKGQWHYFTCGAMLMGSLLDKLVPVSLESYADAKLFKPLNISRYEWQYTPQKVANTAGGIRMNALDFAKYGQLYKNDGLWNGKQVLSKTWVDKTLTKQIEIPGRPEEFYSYLFWNKKYQVKGKEYETFYCSGNGGNKIFVFKDQPLVVVITATAYGTPYAHPQVDKIMQEYILPAVIK